MAKPVRPHCNCSMGTIKMTSQGTRPDVCSLLLYGSFLLDQIDTSNVAKRRDLTSEKLRREDEEPHRQGREAEIWAKTNRLLGGAESDRAEILTVDGVWIDKNTGSKTTRLLTINGVRFRS